MEPLDRLIPKPRLLERDYENLAATPHRVWQLVRHRDLVRSPLVHALFAVRTLPQRFLSSGKAEELHLSADLFHSSPGRPGFQILYERAPRELVVGAIGKVWRVDIPFVHVGGAEAFAAFSKPDYVKVAWAIQTEPLGLRGSRLCIEVRVDATDDWAWQKFRRYFRLVGPGSRFIRHSLLRALVKELGAPEEPDERTTLPGDDLLPDARAQITHHIEIGAPPATVWPWLVQMGCRRGGWYGWDFLDNGGAASADRIIPELQRLDVGDVIPMRPRGPDGFAVLVLEPSRALVLGDPSLLPGRPRSRAGVPRVTWAFSLEPMGDSGTLLVVRIRAEYEPSLKMALMRRALTSFVEVMERKQLRTLKQRAEAG
jgi:proline iminopeptidase